MEHAHFRTFIGTQSIRVRQSEGVRVNSFDIKPPFCTKSEFCLEGDQVFTSKDYFML